MKSKRILSLSFLVALFGSVSSVVLAGDVIVRSFSCSTPWKGASRCGDVDKNLRIPANSSVEVVLTSSEESVSINFHLKHAVSDAELTKEIKVDPLPAKVRKDCKDQSLSEEDCKKEENKHAVLLWTNSKSTAVDVYLNAASVGLNSPKQIQGRVIVKSP